MHTLYSPHQFHTVLQLLCSGRFFRPAALHRVCWSIYPFRVRERSSGYLKSLRPTRNIALKKCAGDGFWLKCERWIWQRAKAWGRRFFPSECMKCGADTNGENYDAWRPLLCDGCSVMVWRGVCWFGSSPRMQQDAESTIFYFCNCLELIGGLFYCLGFFKFIL